MPLSLTLGRLGRGWGGDFYPIKHISKLMKELCAVGTISDAHLIKLLDDAARNSLLFLLLEVPLSEDTLAVGQQQASGL